MRTAALLAACVLCTVPALCLEVQFNRDVRPILSDKCYGCHGPDAAAKKIPFRLDSEAAATADLGRGRRAVIPGDVEHSELIRRVATEKKALRMPPTYTGVTLTAKEIETLSEWVRQGAKCRSTGRSSPPCGPPHRR